MIIDSSTLILAAKTGLLDHIIKNKELEITNKVKEESIVAKESFDSKIIEQRISENKIKVKEIKDVELYDKLIKDFNLGKGEAEAIVLASEKNKTILVDDKKAINSCKILNIKFATALNILVKLHKDNKIKKEETRIILNKLKKYGRYSQDIINKVEEDIK